VRTGIRAGEGAMADLTVLADLKIFLQVEHTDDDTLLSQLITDISDTIEKKTGHFFSEADATEFQSGGSVLLTVGRTPIVYVKRVLFLGHLLSALEDTDFTASADDWTLGASWSYIASGVLHAAGAVAAVTQALPADAGFLYFVQVCLSGLSAGDVTVSIGDTSGTAQSTNGISTEVLEATGGSDLFSLTPSTDFDGRVEWVRVLDASGAQISAKGFAVADSGNGLNRVPSGGDDFWFNPVPVGASPPRALMWAWSPDGYYIDYKGGEGSVPGQIRLATHMWCGALYNRRDQALADETTGDLRVRVDPGSIAVPAAVQKILNRYGGAIGF